MIVSSKVMEKALKEILEEQDKMVVLKKTGTLIKVGDVDVTAHHINADKAEISRYTAERMLRVFEAVPEQPITISFDEKGVMLSGLCF